MNETKKEYLKGYSRAAVSIKMLKQEYVEIREEALSLKAIEYSDMPKSSGKKTDLSDTIVMLEKERDRIVKEIKQCYMQQIRIKNDIREMRSEKYINILTMRYIKNMTWEEIAEKIDRTKRQVERIHGNALEEFEIKHLK